MDEKSTQEKILLSTIDFIEKYGIHSVTTRGIAKEANVNSAAINYYFRSKENLLNEAMNMAIKNLREDFLKITEKEKQSPGEFLQNILYYMMAGSTTYPGLTKAFMYGLFTNNSNQDHFSDFYGEIINYITLHLEKIVEKYNPAELKSSITQMLSAVLFPCLFPSLYNNSIGDITDNSVQKKYVSSLVNKFFKVDTELGDWHPFPM